MQRRRKHAFATIEMLCFLWVRLELYNEDLTQIELDLSRVFEVDKSVVIKKWQERN
jgi:hypothetical protein